MPIPAFDMRIVIEAVRRVNPVVETAAETRLVAVGVAGVIKRTVERFAFIGFAIAVGIFDDPNIRNALDNRGISKQSLGCVSMNDASAYAREWINSDGNVQFAGELRHFARQAVGPEVFEDHDAVAAYAISRRRPRI